MADKSKFVDIIDASYDPEAVVIVEYTDGSRQICPWPTVETIINNPEKQVGGWADIITKWQAEGRI